MKRITQTTNKISEDTLAALLATGFIAFMGLIAIF